MKRRILSIVTALALCLGLCPTWAFAVEGETDTANAPMLADVAAGDVAITEINGQTITFTADQCGDSCRGHTITQTVSAAQNTTILVESGTHNITFSGLTLMTARVGVMPGATMNLILTGDNTISSPNAGIYVPQGATLTVSGDGSLNVSGESGAGIGGSISAPNDTDKYTGDINCGTVIINGGTIIANGGICSAGIGGAFDDYSAGNGGIVTINGGTVTATGGSDDYYGGAGIGGGSYDANKPSGCGGTLTINGGSVTMTAGEFDAQNPAYGFGQGSGRTPSGPCELILANADCLAGGTTLDPKGTYTLNGDPTEDMITVPTGLIYNGQDRTETAKAAISLVSTGNETKEFLGRTFRLIADTAGWDYTIFPEVVQEAGDYIVTYAKDGKTISKTFTVEQSGTEFKGDGVAKAYLMGTEQYTFSVDDPITVIATPTATGQAPTNAAMVASFTEPTGGQMALFVGDKQVSEPVNAKPNGSYSMMTTAQDVLAAAGRLGTIELTARFVESDSQAEAESRVEITITAAAKVTTSSVTYYYGTIDDAWNEAKGKTATVTLLDNVTVTGNLMLQVNGGNVTFDSGEHILTFSGAFQVNSGTLTIIGGTISAPEGLGFHGNVLLRGGTFESGGNIVFTTGTLTSLLNLLDNSDGTYRAFYKNGQPVPLEDNQNSLPAGTYTVAECHHNESVCEYQPIDGTDTHKKTCLACGYTEAAEACAYADPTADDAANHTAVCTLCGQGKTEAHTIILTATVSGSTITVSQKCDSCGYGADVGTVTLTVPTNLTYNDGQSIEWTASEGLDLLDGQITIKFMWNGITLTSGAYSSPISLIDGSDTPFQTGSHTMQVTVKDSQGRTANMVEIPFTISPAKLTDAIVELEPGPFVYTGAAQTPAVTITHNELPLKINLDYALSWSNNTNAGDGASVTITGRGSYTGSVEKTFTIKKATPTVTAPTAGAIQYGQTLAGSALTGGTAVNGSANVAGKWSWASLDTQPTAGGDFAATFTPTDTTNYNTPANVSVDVDVKPATPKITITAPSHQKEGQDVEITCTVENPHDTTKDDLPAVTLTYQIGNGEVQTMTGTSFTIPAGTAVDTVITITAATVDVTGKYSAATKTATVTVTDKTPVTISNAEAENATYDGESHNGYTGTPTAGAYTGNLVISYAKADGTALDGAPTNAGSYTVTISVPSESEYIGSKTLDFTINKANITITADNKTADVGTSKPALTYTVTGLASKDTLATAPTLTCNANMDVLGSYPIIASGAAVPNTSNYNSEITYVDGTLTVTDPTVHVTGVTLDKASLSLTVGGKGQLTATVTPANATDKGVTWTSSNTAVVTVDANGNVTAVSAGTTTITVTTADGAKTATCTVTVRTSGGGGGYTPSNPGTPTTTPTVTVPVSGDQNTVRVSASVSGTTATVSKIDTTQIESVIGNEGQTGMVEIDFTGLGQTIDTVKLPTTAIAEIAAEAQSKKAGGLTVKLSNSEISFDAAALTAIQTQAGSQITLTVAPAKPVDLNTRQKEAVGSAPVYNLTIQSNGRTITDFRGGYATVSLPYTLTAGQNPSGVVVYYLDSTGNITPCTTMYDIRSKSAIFTTGHLSLYFVGYDPAAVWVSPFPDVADGAWYFDAVRFVNENGLMSGYSNGMFGPNDYLSRAQLAQILFNREGRPVVNYLLQFSDVPGEVWYTEAVRWAASQGIVGGYGDGRFGPNDNITREQLAVMLWRYAGSPAATEKELHFTDADQVGKWALEAMRWAVENGIVSGYGNGQLGPQGLATRAQVAQMLMNYLDGQ